MTTTSDVYGKYRQMKILIVDDHALFREGLCHVLDGMEGNIGILEAANYDSALEYVQTIHDLDLVLLDLNMPGKNGFDALDTFTKEYPALPVVILSASDQASDIQRAMDAGALGYIPKDTSSAVMLNALQLVLSGGIYVPPSMLQQRPENSSQAGSGHALTPRQLQVLELLVLGHSNKVIASSLDLAEATIKMHVTSIMKNLGVSNRTQAVIEAEKLGLCL